MVISLISLIIAICLVTLIIVTALVVGFRAFMDREKSSPFECGFDPKSSARISFSLRFFLLAVIFLIFDIEIIFFFPIPYMMWGFMGPQMIILSLVALMILLVGLIHEWREGSLDWSK
uniref:NADH-ubiquinone oxidoreductase chain 3 n=1 Tax=Auchenoplax crinita TaxID=397536 RepID=G8XXK6_AUCCR|nr:NADH dehydrogenase subunit 3 [Auchenoplax crinita]